jgi:hypothetical protein
MRKPPKFFLCKRVATIAGGFATARRQSAKIGRVHLPTPAQGAKRISVLGCEATGSDDKSRNE